MTLHYHVRLTFLASLMNLSELLLEYEPLQGRDRVWLILYHMYLEESLAQNECCLYNHLPQPP